MANLQIKSFQQLVQDQVTAIQGSSSSLVDLSIGSILRSIVESSSAVAMWLQGMILQLLAITRATTSTGSDLDSWVADYGITRLPANRATGRVTFSRFTATNQATIPVGALVQSSDGSQQYAVTADTTNINFYQGSGLYILLAGVQSITIPVQAVIAGFSANAAIGGINTVAQSIPGVDAVTNSAAIENGSDAESDADLRARFIAYIASLSKATKQSVGYAASSLQIGLSYVLVENQQLDGTPKLGYFYLVVDDGTGYPSSSLLSSVYNSVDAVRPITSTFGIFAPTVLMADVSLVITIDPAYNNSATIDIVSLAIKDYVNSLGLGVSLANTRLVQVAYGASSGVINVSQIAINGLSSDFSAGYNNSIKSGSIVVTSG